MFLLTFLLFMILYYDYLYNYLEIFSFFCLCMSMVLCEYGCSVCFIYNVSDCFWFWNFCLPARFISSVNYLSVLTWITFTSFISSRRVSILTSFYILTVGKDTGRISSLRVPCLLHVKHRPC